MIMKYWIDATGYSIAPAIRMGNVIECEGNPIWRTWYGRYDLNVSTFKKLSLIFKNR